MAATASISTPPSLETTKQGLYDPLSKMKAKYIYLTISTPSWIKTALTGKPILLNKYIFIYFII